MTEQELKAEFFARTGRLASEEHGAFSAFCVGARIGQQAEREACAQLCHDAFMYLEHGTDRNDPQDDREAHMLALVAKDLRDDIKKRSNAGLDAFRRGARAMFDYLLYRAANHYHGNPETQKQCDYDNRLIEEWAADALEEVSPDDCAEWRAIGDAYRQGFDAGKRAASNLNSTTQTVV